MNQNTNTRPLTVVLGGATGWAGSALARGITRQADMQLLAAVGRRTAGRTLADVLGDAAVPGRIFDSAAAALASVSACDVYVEYGKAKDMALLKANLHAALAAGCHLVVASSGLSDADYAELDAVAREHRRGVLACGNFALTAVLLQRFAEMAAAYIPNFEIIDYAKDSKPDAPSGTCRELAMRLGRVRQPALGVPLDQVNGPPGVRGASINGVQVHAVRIPGYVLGAEVVFGMADQRLHIRHEAGSGADPYVDGALLAIRKVGGQLGVIRGLDRVMDL
ncbi:4-hydroxy-tetrahydrodipicolinate reductase [Aquabacterium sp.]|uniref:4-hydroxy-tetrahydrodipicolinate reductase n=1 Tax=Aquabacterium sp. TaxID=1872578 RepID=UPI002CDD4C73|nr:dihydrodipicolinate reductase C-terminal domain-containing protein [Aquabacterium sp.]HSW04042.1 dihydrodipicolinate reductase C-terminal domain-containing protein [Aquabacterium sp.]